MRKILDEVFNSYVEEYRRNLTEFYPCEVNSSATLPEANLTMSFLLSCRLKGPYSNAFIWDEFSVKGMCVEADRKGSNMDGLLIDKDKKHIFLIESKRLKYSPEIGLHNEKKDAKITLSSDMARAINVANSDIFPKRIWDKTSGKPFSGIGEDYNNYLTFGISLVSTWFYASNLRITEEEFSQGFKKYLDRSFVGTSLQADLHEKNLPNVNSSNGWILCREISDLFPKLQGKDYQYFILMYVWEIKKQKYTAEPTNEPLLDEPVLENNSKVLGMAACKYFSNKEGAFKIKCCPRWLYFYNDIFWEKGNIKWVAIDAKPNDNIIHLYCAFKDGKMDIPLPAGFVKSRYYKKDSGIEAVIGAINDIRNGNSLNQIMSKIDSALDSLCKEIKLSINN